MKLLHWILVSLCVSLPCYAEEASQAITADLSDMTIRIDTRFTGANLVLFGNRNESGDVVVVVRGPEESFTVRKKEHVGGIWINTQRVNFDTVPSFYAVAASRPLIEIDANLQQILKIQFSSLFPTSLKNVSPELFAQMKEALLERQKEKRLFSDAGAITFVEDSLFKTIITFPDTIPRGRYLAEIYLLDGAELRGAETIPIQVYKSGAEAFVYDMAHRHSFLYGIVAVVVALVAGWVASTIFEKFYV